MLDNLLASAVKDNSLAHRLVEKTSPVDYEDPRGYNALKELLGRGMNSSLFPEEYPNIKLGSSVKDFDNSIRIVKLKSKYRRLKSLNLPKPESVSELESLLDIHEKRVLEIIKDSHTSNQGFYLKDGLSSYFKKKEEQIKSNLSTGIKSGFTKLDNATAGFRGGELITVAGRPSMGKTSFAMSMYCQNLIDNVFPAYFSLEVGQTEFYDKSYSIMSDFVNKPVSYQGIRNPYGNKTILQVMGELTKFFNRENGYLCEDNSISFSEIVSTARELKRQGRLSILYVDHIGLLIKDRSKEREELCNITSGLKKLAKELDIPIVELCQLKRDLDIGKGPPTLSHLKGSGSIEEDSDIVIFPWRPWVIDRSLNPEDAVIIPAKGRNFMGDPIQLHFSTLTTRFKDGSDVW